MLVHHAQSLHVCQVALLHQLLHLEDQSGLLLEVQVQAVWIQGQAELPYHQTEHTT